MVYVLLADGFEDMEAFAPIDILRRADIPVSLIGVGGESVRSSHGVPVQTDGGVDTVDRDALEMLVLPGGRGVETLRADAGTIGLIRYCCENRKLVGAICAAPALLAELGFLRDRRAVCYPSCEEILEAHGARVQRDERVTHDQNLITAQAAGACIEFGLKLAMMLRGWETSERVRKAICFVSGARALT